MKVVEKFMDFTFTAETVDSDLNKGLEAFQKPFSFKVVDAFLTYSKAKNVVINLIGPNEEHAKIAQHNALQALHKAGFVKKGESFKLEAKIFVNTEFTRDEDGKITFTVSATPSMTPTQKAKYDELIGLGVPEDKAKATALATA